MAKSPNLTIIPTTKQLYPFPLLPHPSNLTTRSPSLTLTTPQISTLVMKARQSRIHIIRIDQNQTINPSALFNSPPPPTLSHITQRYPFSTISSLPSLPRLILLTPPPVFLPTLFKIMQKVLSILQLTAKLGLRLQVSS